MLEDCEPPVVASIAAWKERLLTSGAPVCEVQPEFFSEAYSIYAPLQANEAAPLHRGFFDEFEPAIAERLRWGASLKPEEVVAWRKKHQIFVEKMNALFEHSDFLLMPAVPLAKLLAGEDQTAARPRILGYTTPGSLAGLPAVVLPGKPGVQLLAARGQDARLLHFAAQLGRLLAAEHA